MLLFAAVAGLGVVLLSQFHPGSTRAKPHPNQADASPLPQNDN